MVNKAKSYKVLIIGAFYAISISIVIAFLGNLVFSEWISYFFFIIISLVPSVLAVCIILFLDTSSGNFVILINSILLGFFVSFLSLFISLFLDNVFNEQIYWSLSDWESFEWFLSFSIIGAILFTPITFLFVKIARKITT